MLVVSTQKHLVIFLKKQCTSCLAVHGKTIVAISIVKGNSFTNSGTELKTMKVDGNKMKKHHNKMYNEQENNGNIMVYHSLQFKGTIKHVN